MMKDERDDLTSVVRYNRDILLILLDIITAESLESKRAILERHCEAILDNEYVDLLFEWLITNSTYPDKIGEIEKNREIVANCRQFGIRRTFSKLGLNISSPDEGAKSPEIAQLKAESYERELSDDPESQLTKAIRRQTEPYIPAVREYASKRTMQEKKQVVEERACLLLTHMVIDFVFESLIAQNKEDLGVLGAITRDRDLLKACRENGIYVAFGIETSDTYQSAHSLLITLIDLINSCRFRLYQHRFVFSDPNWSATELVTLNHALMDITKRLKGFSLHLAQFLADAPDAKPRYIWEAVEELNALGFYFRKISVWIERARPRHGVFARNWTEFLLNHWENKLEDHEGREIDVGIQNLCTILGVSDTNSFSEPSTAIVAEAIQIAQILEKGVKQLQQTVQDYIISKRLDERYVITEVCRSGDRYRVGLPLYRYEPGEIVTLRCPICFTSMTVRIGKHEIKGQVHGTSADEVSKVVRELLKDVEKMGDKIEVSHSTIGIFSTGEIKKVESISQNIDSLGKAGHSDVGQAVKQVTEAILRSEELSQENKRELLEQLEEISRQAALPKGRRSSAGVIKALLTGIVTGIGAAGGLAEVWSTWGPAIVSFLSK